MKLTIATLTARAEPRYDWLIDGLAAQTQPTDEIELVIIDFFDRDVAELVPGAARVPGLRQIVISPPKPNPWQGPYRVTSRDLHAIATARNTALCLASHDYIAFLDDRAKLGARWLETVRRGEGERIAALAGPCDRLDRHPQGRNNDDRRTRCPLGRQRCSGDWFYGGNFCLPLAWALAVGGCEEGTDPVGHQDRVMGYMLANQGHRIDFVTELGVLQDRRLPDRHPFPRIRKGGPHGDKRRAIGAKFFGLAHTDPALTPDIIATRSRVQAGEPFPMHTLTADDRDWYDGGRIGDM